MAASPVGHGARRLGRLVAREDRQLRGPIANWGPPAGSSIGPCLPAAARAALPGVVLRQPAEVSDTPGDAVATPGQVTEWTAAQRYCGSVGSQSVLSQRYGQPDCSHARPCVSGYCSYIGVRRGGRVPSTYPAAVGREGYPPVRRLAGELVA